MLVIRKHGLQHLKGIIKQNTAKYPIYFLLQFAAYGTNMFSKFGFSPKGQHHRIYQLKARQEWIGGMNGIK